MLGFVLYNAEIMYTNGAPGVTGGVTLSGDGVTDSVTLSGDGVTDSVTLPAPVVTLAEDDVTPTDSETLTDDTLKKTDVICEEEEETPGSSHHNHRTYTTEVNTLRA